MKTKLLIGSLLALGLLTTANAATETANFNVTAQVVKACTITSAPADINFGNYDPTAPNNIVSSTTFGMRCTKGVGYSITIDTASGTPRTMTDGTDSLTYVLKNGSAIWGELQSGNEVSGTAASTAETSFTIDAEVTANQDVSDNSAVYTQTNTITITY